MSFQHQVSILVFLELAPGRQRYPPIRRPRRVSILVFLELAPGPWNFGGLLQSKISFNPCFSGTRARTGVPGACRAGEIRVSILVFLELAPGLRIDNGEFYILDRFNPCFSGTRARTAPRYSDMGLRS